MAQILNMDARALADVIPAESVQCVVTSPPYFGLRNYGVEGQIGLEKSVDEYIDNLLTVFRQVWRALRLNGTLWLNLGDSYWGSGGANNNSGITGRRPGKGADSDDRGGLVSYRQRWGRSGSLKPKDLIGIPWRVAFALQADGWYLRSDIIWHKPNPMPESVTDRPTKAHEYVFLLSKSSNYYYDAAAIREPGKEWAGTAGTFRRDGGKATQYDVPGQTHASHRLDRDDRVASGRNKRSVWTLATQSYEDAHFATFPEKLVEPCLLAGSRPGDLVLDPFAGSGTTLAVAERMQCEAIGVELNPDYCALIEKRLQNNQIQLLA